MQWPKTLIQTPSGQKTAIAPLVISASRATDIPAFHAKWFINRLRAGYCVWENPFNALQRQFISFSNCKAFVFWSKNPQALMPHLKEIDERGYTYYFQYTLNDYELEGLEPRIPPLAKRIATFQKLSEAIGKEKVIWRFDPIILGNTLSVESILERIQRLAERIAPYTEKLVFSFLDLYRKTENNLKKIDPLLRAPKNDECSKLAQGLAEINNSLPTPLILSTCAEKLDLTSLGIEHNKCVDPELLMRLCPSSRELASAYTRPPVLKQVALSESVKVPASVVIKDSGQRTPCGCAPSKDIGSYNTCMHLCAYCYANQSKAAVIKRINAVNINSESL